MTAGSMRQEAVDAPSGDATASRTVRVACAQLVARDLNDHEHALEEALSAVAEAAAMGADLVVLPECTYPAYVLADPVTDVSVRPDSEVEQVFGAAAAERGLWLAVGLAQSWRPGARDARNAALLFGPDGTVHLRTAKRLLWDFDGRWFTPGGRVDPVAWLRPAGSDASSIGMLVCADARMPEIARSLAVGGASIILDPTAWVATGRETASLQNLQPEYLMSVRALENGVWIAAADKVGMERGAVVYAGQSCVIAPDGSVAAMASSDEPEIVMADVDLAAATGPPVSRRPKLYGAIADGGAGSEAAIRVATPVVAAGSVVRVGLLQSRSSMDAAALRARFTDLGAVARALGLGIVACVVTADTHEAASLARSVSADLDALSAVAVADEGGRIRELHVSAGGTVSTAGRTHGSAADPGGSLAARTSDVGTLRVGAIVGPEGLVPEVSRIVTLQGAELLLWVADADTPRALEVARVRAVENRVWVGLIAAARSSSEIDEPLSAVIDPDGRVVAIGLRGRDQLVAGVVNVATARLKQMAPGTDILKGRQPETYSILTDAASAVRQ
jgi:predicted amidohydrolase